MIVRIKTKTEKKYNKVVNFLKENGYELIDSPWFKFDNFVKNHTYWITLNINKKTATYRSKKWYNPNISEISFKQLKEICEPDTVSVVKEDDGNIKILKKDIEKMSNDFNNLAMALSLINPLRRTHDIPLTRFDVLDLNNEHNNKHKYLKNLALTEGIQALKVLIQSFYNSNTHNNDYIITVRPFFKSSKDALIAFGAKREEFKYQTPIFLSYNYLVTSKTSIPVTHTPINFFSFKTEKEAQSFVNKHQDLLTKLSKLYHYDYYNN